MKYRLLQKKYSPRWLNAALVLLLSGCGNSILEPAGPIADAERIILLDSVAIMLALVIPIMIAIGIFIWWFRASNSRAHYLPNWAYSGRLELLVWSIPALTILFLGGIAWIGSHDLDPAKPLKSHVVPLEVEVVSLDWKWLFIYPKQHVASINRLVVPAHVPVHLRITSATVMNVFFVPRISSQIYAMNGMTTELNLEANDGTYHGLSAHFSGDGFSGMAFNLQAVSLGSFGDWVSKTQTGNKTLDEAAYRALLKQSSNVEPYTYRNVAPGLFESIVMQKLPPGDGPPKEN